jgi:hypothetical protein
METLLEKKLAKTSGAEEVVYAMEFSLEESKNGFLRDRDDILARLNIFADSQSQTSPDQQLLFVATTSTAFTDVVTPSLYAISTDRSTRTQHLEILATWNLFNEDSPHHGSGREAPKYSFDTNTGIFQTLKNGRVHAYDLTGLQPVQLPQFHHHGYHLIEFLQISPSLALASSQVHYGLYNTKYDSLLSAQPPSSLQGPNSKKRKQPGDDSGLGLSYVAWFSKLGFAVALTGNSLVSIPVDGRQDRGKRQKLPEPRLIDIIGKGLPSETVKPSLEDRSFQTDPLGTPFKDSAYLEDQGWQQRAQALIELVRDGNVTGFERYFAVDAEMDKLIDSMRPIASMDLNGDANQGYEGPTNDLKRDKSVFFKFKKLPREKYIPLHRPKALFALEQIFRRRSKGSERLEIAFYPPNVFRWLTFTGQLSPELIDQALKLGGKFSADSTPISGADLIAAIVAFDPSFEVLDEVLLEHPHLELDALVHATMYILRSLDDGSTNSLLQQLVPNRKEAAMSGKREKQAKPVMNGELKKKLTNGDANHVKEGNLEENNTEDESKAIFPEVETAAQELNLANSFLESGLPLRSESLRLALTKINGHPTPAIVRTMKEVMSLKELVLLISLLRIELGDGGWHFRYIDTEKEEGDGEEMIPGSMGVAASLLGCVVDAIGVGGWLGAGNGDGDEMAQVLTGLRAEINGILEGIHEATFLKGLLGEFLRFGWKRDNADLREHGTARGIKVLSMEGGDNRSREGDGKALPLGLKVKQGVDTKVVDKGEIKERRQRDVGNEISKGVGKYAYEEIRF